MSLFLKFLLNYHFSREFPFNLVNFGPQTSNYEKYDRSFERTNMLACVVWATFRSSFVVDKVPRVKLHRS